MGRFARKVSRGGGGPRYRVEVTAQGVRQLVAQLDLVEYESYLREETRQGVQWRVAMKAIEKLCDEVRIFRGDELLCEMAIDCSVGEFEDPWEGRESGGAGEEVPEVRRYRFRSEN